MFFGILESILYLLGHSVAHEIVVFGWSVIIFANYCLAIDLKCDLFELVGDLLGTYVVYKLSIQKCTRIVNANRLTISIFKGHQFHELVFIYEHLEDFFLF